MKYRVKIHPEVVSELDEVFAWIAAQSPESAERWLEELQENIRSLGRFPRRCPTAPESDSLGGEVRQLLFGDYRVLFTVDRSEVLVLRVRHAMRRPLR